MIRKTVSLPDMSCTHCVNTVKRELMDLEGVSEVESNLETKVTLIAFDAPATWELIAETLEEIGYPAR